MGCGEIEAECLGDGGHVGRRGHDERRQRRRTRQSLAHQFVDAVGAVGGHPDTRFEDVGLHPEVGIVEVRSRRERSRYPLQRALGRHGPVEQDIRPRQHQLHPRARGDRRRRQFVHQTQQCRHMRVFDERHTAGLHQRHRAIGVACGKGMGHGLGGHAMGGEPLRCRPVQTGDRLGHVTFESTPQELDEQRVEPEPLSFLIHPAQEQIPCLDLLEQRLGAWLSAQRGRQARADAFWW